jgi:hypothetical protein
LLAVALGACNGSGLPQAPPCSDGQTVLVDTLTNQDMGGVWGGNLAVDARGVYYTFFNFGGVGEQHAVVRMPPAGGTPEVLWQGTEVEIFGKGMAVDDRVYVSALRRTVGGNGLFAVPTGGGALQDLGVLTDGTAAYQGVALDAQFVFAATGGAVARAPRSGGAPVNVYASATEGVHWIAAEDGAVYAALDHHLMKLADDGSTATVATVDGISLAIAGSTAYVLTADSVVAVPLDGGAATTLVSGLSMTGTIAADDSGVYVGAADSAPQATASILRVRAGAAPVVLADGIAVEHLALGPTNVYWAGLGQVGRVGKCSK